MFRSAKRMAATRALIALAGFFAAYPLWAIDASNRYRSPRNPERKVRASTELIILHTTEAPERSSLNKLSDRGECHFVVTESGSVYRIVDRDKEAFHAGRSMWNGRSDVDKFSIGIECVGYHDKPMGQVQIAAIRDLVRELKAMYRIPDERVLCHSHVAYGERNKWQKNRHRGRKRCGMLFAMPSVRQALGLKARPAYDPDTRAHRLVVGDPYLKNVLYGSVDTMRGKIGGGNGSAQAPSKGGWLGWLKPTAAPSVEKKQPTAVSAKPTTASAKPTTAGGVVKRIPGTVEELKAAGYVLKGTVSKDVTASRIAGSRWNAPDTYYVIRGKVTPGNAINPARIERGMGVWMKK